MYNHMYAGNFDALLETISAWPDFAKYAEKLRLVREDVVERWRRIYDVNPNHFNTLIHDDFWPPNIMLKINSATDEQPLENVVFIDFQMTFWSSPTIDLYFFLNTSVCEAFRPHRFDELVQFYHQNLVHFLQRLNYKRHIPTWPEFHEQYQERNLLGKEIGISFKFEVLFQESVLKFTGFKISNDYTNQYLSENSDFSIHHIVLGTTDHN